MDEKMSEAPRIRAGWERERVPCYCGGESRTHQEMAESADINNIMKQYERNGLLAHVNQYQGQYGDFTHAPGDFHEAMNQTVAAREMFMTLPAKIRDRFNQDPGEFLDFTQDPANEAEMRELGLLPAEQRPAEPASVEAPSDTEPLSAEGAE